MFIICDIDGMPGALLKRWMLALLALVLVCLEDVCIEFKQYDDNNGA